MFAEHFFGKHFFLGDRSEKALVMCSVFLSPFVLGTKNAFFLGGWGGKKEEEMKIVSVFAVCLWSRVYLSLFSSSNIGSTD